VASAPRGWLLERCLSLADYVRGRAAPRRRPPQHANVAYVPDYDGDGRADLAVWRSRTGEWLILGSRDGSLIRRTWGRETP